MQTERLPPLLFGDNVGRTFTTAEAFFAFTHAATPATLRIPEGSRGFAYKGSQLQLPQMTISTTASDPCTIETHFASPLFGLVIPVVGRGFITAGAQRTAWKSPEDFILNPLAEAQSFTFETIRSQLLFEIDPARLVRTAASLLGPGTPLNGLASPARRWSWRRSGSCASGPTSCRRCNSSTPPSATRRT